MKKHFKILLFGNPNCGKTTLFNSLTGHRQHVGNYPGVTVERKTGTFRLSETSFEIVDLPGIYSLSASSPEENVALQELLDPDVDLILNVVDSSIPQRNLYLTTQLAETHIPMMLVFNMADEARKKGLSFDFEKLQNYLGAPIVQMVSTTGEGLQNFYDTLQNFIQNLDCHDVAKLSYGKDIDDSISDLEKTLSPINLDRLNHIPLRFFAIKLLEKDTAVLNLDEFKNTEPLADTQIQHLYQKHAIQADTFMPDCRYGLIEGACRDAISVSPTHRLEVSNLIDRVVTHKWLGLPIFFAIMYAMFWVTFTCAEPFMGYIEDAFSAFAQLIGTHWPETTAPGWRALLLSGVIGGVSSVLVFLPNIVFLFMMIAILEGTGYMSRVAFVMDGIMRVFGLQGKSFIPLILGFGCSVPAIMATRSIESERDRKTTIMILPLMSCGARLPIYALLIPAFFAEKHQATMMFLIYIIGVLVAFCAARLLKSTLFKGAGEIYIMELPPYRLPSLKSILLHMWDRSVLYIQKAGTIILPISILLFMANTYPQAETFSQDYESQIKTYQSLLTDSSPIEEQEMVQDSITVLENMRQAETIEYTALGRIGKSLEPFFAPLGFDWKITTASFAGLAAKEAFVSQLGILYATGEADETSLPLRTHLRQNYTPLQGFAMMLFALLSIPCFATLAIIKREMNSWFMMFAEAFGLFALAYILTFITYQTLKYFEVGTQLLT